MWLTVLDVARAYPDRSPRSVQRLAVEWYALRSLAGQYVPSVRQVPVRGRRDTATPYRFEIDADDFRLWDDADRARRMPVNRPALAA